MKIEITKKIFKTINVQCRYECISIRTVHIYTRYKTSQVYLKNKKYFFYQLRILAQINHTFELVK